jgi:hypothetical protein
VFLSYHLRHLGKRDRDEADFEALLDQLADCGYGWLPPEGVRAELERMQAMAGRRRLLRLFGRGGR